MTTTDIAPTVAAPVARRRGLIARSLRRTRTRVGLALLALVLLVAFVGPVIAPYGVAQLIGKPFAPPSADALLGTDYLGHDVLSRVLDGGRTVMIMSFLAATVGIVLGALAGMVAGYSRGRLDDVLMRTMDVLLALPTIVFVLLFVSLIGPQLWLVTLLVGIAHVPQVARVVRGVTADVASREFIQSAEALGVPRRAILLREVLPNISAPLLVEYALRVVWSIGAIAGISFLGYGIQQPDADWGLMINENRLGLVQQPLATFVPTVCIAVFAVAVSMIADGVSRTVARVEAGDE
ncbi:MAG: ABC transporter permease [Microbacterium sp.]|uniref:ABC transporter permease n=1 Tax=Microbacterium sp. TaxID=51671 RepID=UPI0039E5A7D0